MDPGLYNVTKTLINWGANVNAYRRGHHGGAPLHHAARRRLEHNVKLLLSSGADALVKNDDGQTPLDVARVKGYSNIVRAIESHLCLFSGWLQELYGPPAPQLLSRKVWVVVLRCDSRNLRKLAIYIYESEQDARPCTIIKLWKANLAEPNFNQPDPAVIVSDTSTKTHIKLAAARETNKQQLQWFCNACKGILQGGHPTFPFNPQLPVVPATASPNQEEIKFDLAIDASLWTAAQQKPPHLDIHPGSGSGAGASTSIPNFIDVTLDTGCHVRGASSPKKGNSSGYNVQEASPSGVADQHFETQGGSSVVQITLENSVPASIPSAPVADAVIDNDGPIHYPQIDATPLDLSQPPLETSNAGADERKDTGTSSSCVICFDAPLEGACIPCGHMAECMRCLNEIKAKEGACPVCSDKIDQVVRIYGADERKDAGTSSSCDICLDAPVEGACIPCGHMAECMHCLNEIKAKEGGCPVCSDKIDQVFRIYVG